MKFVKKLEKTFDIFGKTFYFQYRVSGTNVQDEVISLKPAKAAGKSRAGRVLGPSERVRRFYKKRRYRSWK